MHVQQKTAANGVSARKVVVMGLWWGFAVVYQRKGKVAKYGKTIVKVLILLIEIYLSLQSDFSGFMICIISLSSPSNYRFRLQVQKWLLLSTFNQYSSKKFYNLKRSPELLRCSLKLRLLWVSPFKLHVLRIWKSE